MVEADLPLIREIVVVEGKDDVSAVKRAVRAELLTTSGLGLSRQRLEEIRRAQERCGVIIFTDPDGPGARIRQKIDQAVPGCKHAFLYRERKAKAGGVGVEYASPEEIRQALAQARTNTAGFCTKKTTSGPNAMEGAGKKNGADADPAAGGVEAGNVTKEEQEEPITLGELAELGLSGCPKAQSRRDQIARILGVGQTNSKQFLRRLNSYGISRRELAAALKKAGLSIFQGEV